MLRLKRGGGSKATAGGIGRRRRRRRRISREVTPQGTKKIRRRLLPLWRALPKKTWDFLDSFSIPSNRTQVIAKSCKSVKKRFYENETVFFSAKGGNNFSSIPARIHRNKSHQFPLIPISFIEHDHSPSLHRGRPQNTMIPSPPPPHRDTWIIIAYTRPTDMLFPVIAFFCLFSFRKKKRMDGEKRGEGYYHHSKVTPSLFLKSRE